MPRGRSRRRRKRRALHSPTHRQRSTSDNNNIHSENSLESLDHSPARRQKKKRRAQREKQSINQRLIDINSQD